jgi:hypothetical protein
MNDKKKPIATDIPVLIKYNKAVELANKIRPSMLQKQSRSRIKRLDTPLAPSPAPTYIDNTYTKKPIVKNK